MTDSLPPRIQQVVDAIAEARARRLRNEMLSRVEPATENRRETAMEGQDGATKNGSATGADVSTTSGTTENGSIVDENMVTGAANR